MSGVRICLTEKLRNLSIHNRQMIDQAFGRSSVEVPKRDDIEEIEASLKYDDSKEPLSLTILYKTNLRRS